MCGHAALPHALQVTEAQAREWFADWKVAFNKTYATPEEEATAFTAFTANMRKVARCNRNATASSYWATGNK